MQTKRIKKLITQQQHIISSTRAEELSHIIITMRSLRRLTNLSASSSLTTPTSFYKSRSWNNTNAGGVTLLSSSRLMTTTSSPPPSPKGFYELRRYKIPPAKRAEYIKLCEESSQLRKKLTQNGFCGFYVPEVGSELNTVTHVYHYEDYDHRDKVRSDMRKNE